MIWKYKKKKINHENRISVHRAVQRTPQVTPSSPYGTTTRRGHGLEKSPITLRHLTRPPGGPRGRWPARHEIQVKSWKPWKIMKTMKQNQVNLRSESIGPRSSWWSRRWRGVGKWLLLAVSTSCGCPECIRTRWCDLGCPLESPVDWNPVFMIYHFLTFFCPFFVLFLVLSRNTKYTS